MDKLAALAAAHAPPRRDIDVIVASCDLSRRRAAPGYARALRHQGQGHGATPAPAPASQLMGREVEQADAGMIQFTALPEPRATATAARPWRCRVCQVECGGREGYREHCMSDEHYAGLQLFALHSHLFTDRPNLCDHKSF
uniref:C2H2-type domain-containing protein n=1 Tax=Oryza punctata TaxID=4537 RepID=A0A0E0MNS7_ORYPU